MAAMEVFKKDFPNEYAAVESRFKAVNQDINARVYAAVQQVLTQITPLATATMENATERHFAALHTAYSDYDVVIPKVAEWIKTQPTYLQPTLQAVYDGGTTQDVMALVADYKKATGAVPAPVPAPVPVPAPAPAGVDDLTPVGTRRATPVPRGTPDPNDFDGAFAEAAAAVR